MSSKSPHGAAWVSVVLLFVAGAATFLLQHRDDSLAPFLHHGNVSAHGMAIAKNLSPDRHFVMYRATKIDANGVESLDVYNRFPIVPYLLVKGAFLVAGPDIATQIYYARQLMNAFFLGAGLFAFLIVLRLSRNHWLALACSGLAFSTYFVHYYSDMVHVESPSLFGVLMTIYAIVCRETEGRRLPVWFVAPLSACFGFEVFSVLGVWVVFDLIRGRSLRPAVLWRSIALRTTALAGVCALALLTLNIVNESLAVGSAEETLRRIYNRTGVWGDDIDWPDYLEKLGNRVILTAIPHPVRELVSPDVHRRKFGTAPDNRATLLVIAAAILGLALLSFAFDRKLPRRSLLLMALSGIPWMIGMRKYCLPHEFLAMFMIGIPLWAFYALFARLPRGILAALAFVSVATFIYTSADWNTKKASFAQRGITTDFQRIVDRLGGGKRVVSPDPYLTKLMFGTEFYLCGNTFAPPGQAEFMVTRNPQWRAISLTRENETVHLIRLKDIAIPDTQLVAETLADGNVRFTATFGAGLQQRNCVLLPSTAAGSPNAITPDLATALALQGRLAYTPVQRLGDAGRTRFTIPPSARRGTGQSTRWQAFVINLAGKLVATSNIVVISPSDTATDKQ